LQHSGTLVINWRVDDSLF